MPLGANLLNTVFLILSRVSPYSTDWVMVYDNKSRLRSVSGLKPMIFYLECLPMLHVYCGVSNALEHLDLRIIQHKLISHFTTNGSHFQIINILCFYLLFIFVFYYCLLIRPFMCIFNLCIVHILLLIHNDLKHTNPHMKHRLLY